MQNSNVSHNVSNIHHLLFSSGRHKWGCKFTLPKQLFGLQEIIALLVSATETTRL